MKQEAPDPMPLRELVAAYRGKPGERVYLTGDDYDRGQGSRGLTLIVNITGPDSYHPERPVSVNHLFPVPPAAYDSRSWRRWLFDRLSDVDTHERCEWFRVELTEGAEHRSWVDNDTAVRCACLHGADHYDDSPPPPVRLDRPYAPSHGPGNDPYLVRELGTDIDKRTSFRGELNPGG
jgi:hypothetical protein